MFRAQTNQFDEVVVKATDENLTSENWALILDVCDRVSSAPNGPASAVAALIKRLAHRNANVQIYTLELANALSQNCGPPLHREIASRSFTEALLRLANDRNTHAQVKTKVMERMQGWTDMFRADPDLGIMAQACDKLRRGNPGLEAPSKPMKHDIEDVDRRKEDEELQMALALSLREKNASAAASTSVRDDNPVQSDASQNADQSAPRQGTTAATVSRVRALYDFSPTEAGELAFKKGDVIAVLESVYKDWWKGSLRGETGIFPLNYVDKLQDPTKQELEQDADTEAQVFAQMRNVEKLLALLSVRGDGMGARSDDSEEEITELYHQTLAIRPKLIELIGKYSQKKDDFTQLNEKFIKARRDYETLLESSMAQSYTRPQPTNQPYHNAYGPPPQQYGSTYAPQQHSQPPHSQTPSYNPQYPQQPVGYSSPPPQQQTNHAAPSAPFHFLPNANPAAQDPRQDPRQSMPPYPNMTATPVQMQPPHERPPSVQSVNPGFPQELAVSNEGRPGQAGHAPYQAVTYPPAQTQQPFQLPSQQHTQSQDSGHAPQQQYNDPRQNVYASASPAPQTQQYIQPGYQNPPQQQPIQQTQQQQSQQQPLQQTYNTQSQQQYPMRPRTSSVEHGDRLPHMPLLNEPYQSREVGPTIPSVNDTHEPDTYAASNGYTGSSTVDGHTHAPIAQVPQNADDDVSDYYR